MIHHYLQRGFSVEHLLSLEPMEKAFYKGSIALALEEEEERWKALGGGDG